jgi:hypothetical protein
MAFTHTKKVKIRSFLMAKIWIRIRPQTSGSESDQKGQYPTGSGTLTVGLELEPHKFLPGAEDSYKWCGSATLINCPLSSVVDPDPDLFGRIRTSRTGSGSCLVKGLFIHFFSVCKGPKYLGNLCFLSFWAMTKFWCGSGGSGSYPTV